MEQLERITAHECKVETIERGSQRCATGGWQEWLGMVGQEHFLTEKFKVGYLLTSHLDFLS